MSLSIVGAGVKPMVAAVAVASVALAAIGVGAVLYLREESPIAAPGTVGAPSESITSTAAGSPMAAFEGELANVRIQTAPVTTSGFDICSEGLRPLTVAEAEARLAQPGPLSIDAAKLGPSLRPSPAAPEGWLCGDTLAVTSRILRIEPGTAGVNPGGGTVTVTRSLGPAVVSVTAPRSYWEVTAIGPQAAAIFELPTSEGRDAKCLGVAVEADTKVFTQVMGTTAQRAFCLQTLAAVLAQ